MMHVQSSVWAKLANILIVAMMFISDPCVAKSVTDRYYSDQTALSPNGRFRLDAKSPDNAGPNPRPFADEFVYTLTDTKTDTVIWKRIQPDGERSPLEVFLNDEAWVVVHDAGIGIMVFEPATGRKSLRVSVPDQFSDDERREHISITTAGSSWGYGTRWYFLVYENRTHFVARCLWGRRIILDLDRGVLVKNHPAGVTRLCEDSETVFAIKTLKTARDILLDATESAWRVQEPIGSSIIIAGQLGLREAVPYLRQLEELNQARDFGSGWGAQGTIEPESINPLDYATIPVRQQSQTALRRLGEKPKEVPCTWFRYEAYGRSDKYVDVYPLPGPRADQVHRLSKNDRPIDVLRQIGAPDFITYRDGEKFWEYDMDTDKPYTLRIKWTDAKRAELFKRIEPALWMNGDIRDGSGIW